MKTPIVLVAILSLCVAAGCTTPTVDDNGFPGPLTRALGDLTAERYKAEDAVAQVKRDFADESEEMREAEQLYSEARANANAFLELVRGGLDLQLDQEEVDRLAAASAQATHTLDTYVRSARYSESQAQAQIQMAEPATISLIAGILTKAAIDIWREYRQIDQERRDRVENRIISYEWKPFEEIEAFQTR